MRSTRSLARQQRPATTSAVAAERRPEADATNGSIPPSGNSERRARRRRRRSARRRPAPSARLAGAPPMTPTRAPASARNSAGDRAGQRGEAGEQRAERSGGRRWAASSAREPDGDAERERQPAGDERRAVAAANHSAPARRARRSRPLDEPREQRRGRDRRQRAREPRRRAARPAAGTGRCRPGGGGPPYQPLSHSAKPSAPNSADAVLLRGEVGAGRVDEQIRRRRGARPPAAGARASATRRRAASRSRRGEVDATVSTSSGRSSHGQWPAPATAEPAAAQRLGVGRAEARRDVRVALAPEHERRRSRCAPSPAPARASTPRRRAAVQAQDRALRALVEVLARPSRARGIERPAPAARRRLQPASSLPITSSPSTRRAPDARDPVPAVAGQQRDRVDDHEPLDPLGRRIANAGRRAPVVHDEAARARARVRRAKRSTNAAEAVHRVVEVAALGRCGRSRAGRARSRRPRSRNGSQSSRVGRDAVQVERRATPLRGGLAPEDSASPSTSSVCSVTCGHGAAEDTVGRMRTLCLGEALVDLVCERPVAARARPTASSRTSAARSPTSP